MTLHVLYVFKADNPHALPFIEDVESNESILAPNIAQVPYLLREKTAPCCPISIIISKNVKSIDIMMANDRRLMCPEATIQPTTLCRQQPLWRWLSASVEADEECLRGLCKMKM
jgi:hypothetical protein